MPHDLAATSIGHYQLLHTIGEGSFAKVKLARHILTGVEVAVKAINRRGAYRPLQEIKTMKSLNHPNIVKLYQVIDTEYTIFLVMEHASRGSLSGYLQRFGCMKEHEAQGIFRQLISAVHYCHQKGIVHRDLKPENVLLDAELNVKLADFGLSSGYVGRKLHLFCGSIPYVAPEVFLRQGYDGPGADVWSLGVILYETVTGKLPFMALDVTVLRQKILTGQYQVPYFVSFLCKNILKKILTLDPQNRGTLEELMKDPWVNMGQEEELQPYTELPCENVNPQVIQEMLTLGFEQRQIEEAVTSGKYNSVLATYLILKHKTPKVKCRTIRIRPFPAAESFLDSYGSSLPNSNQPSGQEAKEPVTPPASLDLRIATPSPALQHGPADSSTHGTSGNCSGKAPEGIDGENTLPAEQPDGVTSTSSLGHGQGCRRLARRFWNFVVRHVCWKKRRGKLGKWAQVKPM